MVPNRVPGGGLPVRRAIVSLGIQVGLERERICVNVLSGTATIMTIGGLSQVPGDIPVCLWTD